MILVIPFGFSNSLIEPSVLPKLLLLQGALFCLWPLIIYRLLKNPEDLNLTLLNNGIVKIILLFLLLSIITSVFAINKSESLFDIIKLFTFILFFMAALLLYSADFILYITMSLTTVGFVLAVMGILQFFGFAFKNLPGYYYPYATLANKNMLAAALMLLVPFALAGLSLLKGKFRIFVWVTFYTMLFCLILTRTRAAWLGLVIDSSAALLMYLYLNRFK